MISHRNTASSYQSSKVTVISVKYHTDAFYKFVVDSLIEDDDVMMKLFV
jgi:hypothetical protein